MINGIKNCREVKKTKMCYCRRSVVCYSRPSTLEQSTCRRPVCLVTHNISSEAENSFSAILPIQYIVL